jgi:hypothetical protein
MPPSNVVSRVLPTLTPNLFLDHTLNLKRGPDGCELVPEVGLGEGDGSICPSVIFALGMEAAWQVVGDDDAVIIHASVEYLAPARVDGGLITSRGYLFRAGRTARSEGTVLQANKLLARVMAVFAHFERRAG